MTQLLYIMSNTRSTTFYRAKNVILDLSACLFAYPVVETLEAEKLNGTNLKNNEFLYLHNEYGAGTEETNPLESCSNQTPDDLPPSQASDLDVSISENDSMGNAVSGESSREGYAHIKVPPVESWKVRKQVNSGFLRRDTAHVKSVFDRHCAFKGSDHRAHLSYIPKEKLQTVLKDLDVDVDAKQADVLFDEFDPDKSYGLDFDEFMLLLKNSTPISEWGNNLMLCELLADAIPKVPGIHPLRVVSKLTRSDVHSICEGMMEGLERIIWESALDLNSAFEAMDRKVQGHDDSKFSMIPMSCGKIDDFHAGIESRIGQCFANFRPF